MPVVRLLGIQRPSLPAALEARGMTIGAGGIVFAAAGQASPAAEVMIEVGDEASAAALLEAGAGDVALPRDPDALVAARLAALARRGAAGVIRHGDLRIDTVERRVTRQERPVSLLPREYALLLHLARAAGRTVSRAGLREGVWGRDFDPGTNVIEVHVSRLRAKLHRGFAEPVLLTDKGRGYRLAAVDAIAALPAGG